MNKTVDVFFSKSLLIDQ